jgi:DNA-binding MarR family transcriptional regulator
VNNQPAPGPGWAKPGEFSNLVWELIRHARLIHQAKQRLLTNEALDVGAIGILGQLSHCGASRQGELADLAKLDPSTVSRHVAQLVKAGLITRQPDPADGRAVQLVVTDLGKDRITEAKRRREAMISDALTRWSDEDVARLTELLTRLNDDIETFHQTETP